MFFPSYKQLPKQVEGGEYPIQQFSYTLVSCILELFNNSGLYAKWNRPQRNYWKSPTL